MRRFRWSNIPIPEGHVVSLVTGAALHLWLPLKLFEVSQLKLLLGGAVVLIGVLLTTWAVVTIKDMSISRSTRIIDTGPYRFSRNPMYVAWTLSYCGMIILPE